MGRRSETPSATEENDEEVPTTGTVSRTPRAASKRKSMKEIDDSEEETVTPSRKRKSAKYDKDEEPSEANTEESEDEATTSKPSSSKNKRKASKKAKPKDDTDESEEESQKNENEENEKPPPKKSGRKKKETAPKNEEDQEYEVDKIVDDRAIKGRIQYKIRWKGYLSEDDTWEDESTLDCTELIEEYNDAKGDDAPPNGSSDPPAAKTSKSRGRSTKSDDKKGKKEKAAAPEKKSGKDSRYGHNAPDPNGEWEVSKLIDMHTLRNGSREFLVRWKGYPPEDDSWEPEEHLKGTEILEKFLKKVEQNDTTSRSGSRRTAKVCYKDDDDGEEEETLTPSRKRARSSKTDTRHHPEDIEPVVGGVTLADLENCFTSVIDKKRLAKQDKLDELIESFEQLRKDNENLRKTVEDLQSKMAN